MELTSDGNLTLINIDSIDAIHDRGETNGTELIIRGTGVVVDQSIQTVTEKLFAAWAYLDAESLEDLE